MARVSLTIERDNGVAVSASGEVDDALVADIAMTLGAILFDASCPPAESPTGAVSSGPEVEKTENDEPV